MKINKKCLLINNILIAITGVVLLLTPSSYAAGDLRAPRGETGYVLVTGIEENYLTTSENRYVVTKDTSVHDDYGEAILYAGIKRSSLVRVLYKRDKGQLIAVDIIVKKSTSEKQPE